MHQLSNLLDQLAHRIAVVTDEGAGVPAAAAVVTNLERLAGAELGAPDADAGLVARRFARVHRLLLQAAPTQELDAQLRRQLVLLDEPFTAMLAAWNHWQDLRGVDAPLGERLAARSMVELSRGRLWHGARTRRAGS